MLSDLIEWNDWKTEMNGFEEKEAIDAVDWTLVNFTVDQIDAGVEAIKICW